MRGAARVANLLDNVLRKYWYAATFRLVEANGDAALLVLDADGNPLAVVALDASARGIEGLLLVLNPDKLREFAAGG